MIKVLVVLCVWAIISGACSGTNKVTYADGGLTKITEKGHITVVGLATDQLRRTAIMDDKKVYYVMKDIWGGWPKNVEGKKVKASGKLLIIDRTELMKITKYIQGGPAVMYILADAKWEVVE